MRKPKSNDQRKTKETNISVSACVDMANHLKNNIERIVDRGYTMGYSMVETQPGWMAIDASAVEVFVRVHIHLSDGNKLMDTHINTCFLFTCTKEKEGKYRFTWTNSLS